MSKEKMIAEASSFYASCVGLHGCFDRTVAFVMSEFGTSKSDAEEVATAAYAECVDAFE
jgi:hypothetical protein